jgi:uncharacterized protein (TIGR03435 family)
MISRTVLLLVLNALLNAQSSEFEVATVKLSPPPEGDHIYINLGRILHGKVTLTNATLSDCIKFAYDLSSDVQLAGPDWIRREPRFDIAAQAPPDTPRARLLLMMQRLLGDRLGLRLHREDRDLTYLALVRGKDSSKLQKSDNDTPANGPSLPGRIISPRMEIKTLAKVISRFERQPVIDETGLEGYYAVHLEYATERLGAAVPGGDAAGTPGEADRPAGPSLYSAVQEQLGLKLERRKGYVPVLVIDSAEKSPGAN